MKKAAASKAPLIPKTISELGIYFQRNLKLKNAARQSCNYPNLGVGFTIKNKFNGKYYKVLNSVYHGRNNLSLFGIEIKKNRGNDSSKGLNSVKLKKDSEISLIEAPSQFKITNYHVNYNLNGNLYNLDKMKKIINSKNKIWEQRNKLFQKEEVKEEKKKLV